MKGWDKLREQRHAKQISMGLVDREMAFAPRPPEMPAWDVAGP